MVSDGPTLFGRDSKEGLSHLAEAGEEEGFVPSGAFNLGADGSLVWIASEQVASVDASRPHQLPWPSTNLGVGKRVGAFARFDPMLAFS